LENKRKAADCGWILRATRVQDSTMFHIRKSIQLHDCFAFNHPGHAQATASFIALTIEEKLREMLNYSPIDIVKDMRRDFGIHITYSKAFRVKEHALATINGSHEDAYKTLPEYCQGSIESNPGTVAILDIDDDHKFRRLFVCFEASMREFIQWHPLNVVYSIVVVVSK